MRMYTVETLMRARAQFDYVEDADLRRRAKAQFDRLLDAAEVNRARS